MQNVFYVFLPSIIVKGGVKRGREAKRKGGQEGGRQGKFPFPFPFALLVSCFFHRRTETTRRFLQIILQTHHVISEPCLDLMDCKAIKAVAPVACICIYMYIRYSSGLLLSLTSLLYPLCTDERGDIKVPST